MSDDLSGDMLAPSWPNLVSKFSCYLIFFPPRAGVGCRKSELDTCQQPNINEKKGKSFCRKSAIDVVSRIHVYIH